MVSEVVVVTTPAQGLVGMNLTGGWEVIAQSPKLPGATGGIFSEGYIVKRSGDKRGYYLKALDLSSALRSSDPTRSLQGMTSAYNYERDLLNLCRGKNLDRVVMSVDDGAIQAGLLDPVIPVPYLIFELADGDVRSQMDAIDTFDLAWSLRSLHHVATGLCQLHRETIVHQDLKPSNVLVFSGAESRLGDLGRASSRNGPAPHDNFEVAGDHAYAPPELLYGYVPADWNQRRYGCDVYLLGSMAVFFFTRLSMTSLLLLELHSSQHPKVWQGTFADVLPYVRDAFGRGMIQFENNLPSEIKSKLGYAIRQLCDPDPDFRGHPIDRAGRGNSYSLERYMTLFDLLARRAEWTMRKTRI